MRFSSEDMRDALDGGSFDLTYEADLYVGDERMIEDIPIVSPSFNWDGSAAVEGSGSGTIRFTSDHGESLKPTEPQDWLAPFGSRLWIYARVSVPPTFSERVLLGVFDITAVPSADDSLFVWQTTRVNVGSVVEVEFKDRMVEVQRDRFTQLAQPSQLTSVYTEMVNLTGFQLLRTVTDKPITRSVVYEEDRVKALQDLASILGGDAFMESDGTLSVRPDTPGSVVAALKVGEEGTIASVGSSLDSDGVYNGIVIRSETDGQQAILAERWITEGPLRATLPGGQRTPYHRVPKFYSNPYITTQVQAEATIDAMLASISKPRAATLEIQCFANPLLQVGDVVTVTDETTKWTVRLTRISLGAGGYMTVNAEVVKYEVIL